MIAPSIKGFRRSFWCYHIKFSHLYKNSTEPKKNKIIFYVSPVFLKNFSQFFIHRGFSEKSAGFCSSEDGIFILEKNHFSLEELRRYFTAIVDDTFDSIPQDKLSLRAPKAYYDTESNTEVKFLPQNSKEVTCFKCHKAITEKRKGFTPEENKTYCSLDCLEKAFVEQEKNAAYLFTLLDEAHLLLDNEKLILKQCGVLFYLRAALLMSSIRQENGIVYQLPLPSLISKLKAIIDCPETDKPAIWKSTLALCSSWKITSNFLLTNLQVFQALKQNYFKDLLQKRPKGKAYREIEEIECLFDPASKLSTLQQGWFVNLKKAFNFSSSSDSTILLYLYCDLVDRIHKRVGIPFDNLESVLKIEYELGDLETALRALGHRENPLNLKQRKKKKGSENSQEKYSTSASDEGKNKEGSLTIQEATKFLPFPSTQSFTEGFKQVESPKKRVKIVHSLFGECKPYTVSLFKVRHLVPPILQEAYEQWKACKITKDSYRIKLLFALAHEAVQQPNCLYYNFYNTLALRCPSVNDPSIEEKLDIHHLFSPMIDTFMRSYGIAERIGTDLIQVSILGQLEYDQVKRIGFFQSTFTKEGIRIHRCFKPYTASSISLVLKEILYNFLNGINGNEEYAEVINELKSLLARA